MVHIALLHSRYPGRIDPVLDMIKFSSGSGYIFSVADEKRYQILKDFL